jgi:hypothetical protein
LGNPNFNGSDSLTVFSTDSAGTPLSDSDTVPITVSAVNDPTIIGGSSIGSGNEDNNITGTLTASDLDGLAAAGAFSISTNSAHQPANGTATINASTGQWTYTPRADFYGTDSFTITVTDALGNLTTQVVSLTVNSVADIISDSVSTPSDTSVTFNPVGGTSGTYADNFEGSAPQITAINGVPITAGGSAIAVSNGVVSLGAGNELTFTPAANYTGPATFTYSVTSGGVTESTTVRVTVTARPHDTSAPLLEEHPIPPAPGSFATPLFAFTTPALPVATVSSLHVLATTSASSAERALNSSGLGGMALSAPLRGEVAAQLPDSLLFNAVAGGPALISEPVLGQVQTFRPSLFVTNAVRHADLVADDGTFVQRVVRTSQLEAAVRHAMIDARLAGSPGSDSLLNPFALGAPRPLEGDAPPVQSRRASDPSVAEPQVVEPLAVQAEGLGDAAMLTPDNMMHSVAMTPLPEPETRGAQGFRSQLSRMAAERQFGVRPMPRDSASV